MQLCQHLKKSEEKSHFPTHFWLPEINILTVSYEHSHRGAHTYWDMVKCPGHVLGPFLLKITWLGHSNLRLLSCIVCFLAMFLELRAPLLLENKNSHVKKFCPFCLRLFFVILTFPEMSARRLTFRVSMTLFCLMSLLLLPRLLLLLLLLLPRHPTAEFCCHLLTLLDSHL